MNETKARIKNLKPGDISRIVHNPNVSLDHLHDINKQQDSYKRKLKKLDFKETVRPNCFFPHGVVEEDGVFKLYDQALFTTTSDVFTPEGRKFSTNAKLSNNSSNNGVATDFQSLGESEIETIQEETIKPFVNFQIPPDHDGFSSSSNHPGVNTLEDYEFSNDEDVDVTSPNDMLKTNFLTSVEMKRYAFRVACSLILNKVV